MLQADVDIRDVLEQQRKLEGFDRIAREEFSRAMTQAIHLSLTDIKPRVPTGSGALAGSLHGEIRFAMGDEVRGVLTAEARGANGFPYGYALDASKRYHYAGRRKMTRRYFKGVISRQRKAIYALFEQGTERIVRRLEVHGSGA